MAAEPNWCNLLQEARTAYHDYCRGKAVVEFRDQNNEMVKYSAVNIAKLQDYIRDLEAKCNPIAGRINRPRPIGFLF